MYITYIFIVPINIYTGSINIYTRKINIFVGPINIWTSMSNDRTYTAPINSWTSLINDRTSCFNNEDIAINFCVNITLVLALRRTC